VVAKRASRGQVWSQHKQLKLPSRRGGTMQARWGQRPVKKVSLSQEMEARMWMLRKERAPTEASRAVPGESS